MKEKKLFQLSYPLLLNALIGMVVMLVDTYILSSYSENAAAAVSIANQILLVAFDLSSLFATGAVVLISRSLGEGNQLKAKRMAETAMVANGCVSFMLGMVIFVAAPVMAAAINCPPLIIEDAITYLRVGAFTIVFNGVMIAGSGTLRGWGETRVLLVLGTLAYMAYLATSYVLVFGWGPFPEWGVFGSAVATLVIRMLAVVAILCVISSHLKWTPSFWRRGWGETMDRMRQMFQLSWPAALDNLAYGFYQMILVSFIAPFSVAMLLSRTFTLVLSAVLTVVLMSISQASEVLVGYHYGAKRFRKLSQCVMQSAIAASILTTALAIPLYIFTEPLIKLFTDQTTIHGLVKELLWLTIFVQPFSAVNTILFHSLKTLGDVKFPVAGTQIMMWGLSVPMAYFLAVSSGMGVIGLWYVLIMEELLKALFLILRWCLRFRKYSKPDIA